MAKMCDSALDGDQASCLRLYERLMPLNELLFVEINPIAIKWALCRMGLIGPEIRLPLTSLSNAHHAALEKVMNNLELI